MRILIDINHPAHVHYFKNLIRLMKVNGHEFLIISRDKEIAQVLLDKYAIPYLNRGKGGNSVVRKAMYFFKAIRFIFRKAREWKPDIIVSFGTPYPAISGWLLRIPHISINDTEHARLHHLLTDTFSKYILTPSCYNKNLGGKQIRFDGYMELCYLHPDIYTPNISILNFLNLQPGEKYVILRFVSWNASHDIGHQGLTIETKRKAVSEFSKYAKVFISSEGELPDDLRQFQIKIPPERMHDALAYAYLLYGESATMASECACLGVPAIFHDNEGRGYTDEEEARYGLIFNYTESAKDQEESIDKAISLLQDPTVTENWKLKRSKMLKDKINVTDYLVTFFEEMTSPDKP